MTARSFALGLMAAVLLTCALSTGGDLFWLLFWLLTLLYLGGLCAVIWTRRTLSVSCALNTGRVSRMGQAELTVTIAHRCPLPVAALQLGLRVAEREQIAEIDVAARPYAKNRLQKTLLCPHVGAYPAGVAEVCVRDVFGVVELVKRLPEREDALVVVPNVYLTDPLRFSPGESDSASMSRAFEDATLPSDFRAFQQGDELKKVHWKLSMRRHELIVRTYEQPMRPDVLLLVDCAPPDEAAGEPEGVRDAICEAAASVASVALGAGAPVRMPLLASEPEDINAGKPEDLSQILDALGRCAFDGTQQFERVLLLETRRMRRTGSTAIVTSRMNPVIADMILRIRRMGPKVRVLLAARPDDEGVALLVRRLMRNDVEVTPIG